MPESKEEFPLHAEGRTWAPFVGLASPQHSGQASLLPVVPPCSAAFVNGLFPQVDMGWGMEGAEGRAAFPALNAATQGDKGNFLSSWS